MKEKNPNQSSYIKEKFPILVSVVSGIITIIYSLLAKSGYYDIFLSLIIVLCVTFLSSSILKFYLNKKVFQEKEIPMDESKTEGGRAESGTDPDEIEEDYD